MSHRKSKKRLGKHSVLHSKWSCLIVWFLFFKLPSKKSRTLDEIDLFQCQFLILIISNTFTLKKYRNCGLRRTFKHGFTKWNCYLPFPFRLHYKQIGLPILKLLDFELYQVDDVLSQIIENSSNIHKRNITHNIFFKQCRVVGF